METSPSAVRELSLLEHIEKDPDITQASLASQLGVAVGTVNWHLKRLVAKGYVKVKRAQRRKLRYIITPQGVALRARLTVEFIDRSFQLYRRTRGKVTKLLKELKASGHHAIRIDGQEQGPEDILDICKLSCIEQEIEVVERMDVPVLVIRGVRVSVEEAVEVNAGA
ncbi:MAG: winged helix-turn-helix domain-containing protein [Chloroflexota bacterium]